MATPALRRVKERNPSCRVTFYTHFANLVRGLPFIDEVRPVDAAPPGKSIRLRYENLVPVRRHIAGIFGEILEFDRNNRPSCVLDPRLLDHYRHEFRDLPHPWIILNRKAGPWSPNKNWPDPHWQELIGRLMRRAAVIETGQGVAGEPAIKAITSTSWTSSRWRRLPRHRPLPPTCTSVRTRARSSRRGLRRPGRHHFRRIHRAILHVLSGQYRSLLAPALRALLVHRALPVWPPVSAPDHPAAGGRGPETALGTQ